MPLIKLVVHFIPWTFHLIEDVEAPIDGVVLIGVLICTDVAHASLATATKLESFYVRVLILVVNATGGDILGQLGRLHGSLLGC